MLRRSKDMAELREKRGRSSGNDGTRSEVESAIFDCLPVMRGIEAEDQRRDLVSAGEFSEAFKALSEALRSNTK